MVPRLCLFYSLPKLVCSSSQFLIKGHPQNFALDIKLPFTSISRLTFLLLFVRFLHYTSQPCYYITFKCVCPCIPLFAINVFFSICSRDNPSLSLETWCFWMCWTEPLCFLLTAVLLFFFNASSDWWNVVFFNMQRWICRNVICFVVGDVKLQNYTYQKQEP